jgi:hypothetical protein
MNTPPPPPPPPQFIQPAKEQTSMALPQPPPPPPQRNSVVPPPPPMSRTDSPPVKKKWTVETPQQAEKKNMSVAKAFKFWERDVNWENVRGMHLSDNENAGVFFVETEEPDSYIVIKASSSLANEIFGSDVARLLDLYAPRMRLIEYNAPTMETLKDPQTGKLVTKQVKGARDWRRCQNVLMGYNSKNTNSGQQRKAEKELNRAFFIMMELIAPACTLESLAYHCHENGLNVQNIIKNESFLDGIGRLVVLDVFLNNQDRIPVGDVWSNEGNAGNVMLQVINEENVRVAAIDSVCMPIYVEFIQKYLHRVEKFVQQMRGPDHLHNIYIDSIVKFIEMNIGAENVLGDRERTLIVDGIRSALDKLKGYSLDDFEKMQRQIDSLKKGSDWADVWVNSMVMVDPMFMHSVASIFAKYN